MLDPDGLVDPCVGRALPGPGIAAGILGRSMRAPGLPDALREVVARQVDRVGGDLPFGRTVARIVLDQLDPEAFAAVLDHRLEASGGKSLLTPGLKKLLVERSLGNPRVLLSLAQQLLIEAAGRGVARIDEKLFLEAFGQDERRPRQRAKSR